MGGVPLMQMRDDGLSANECYPQMLINDPTFAILNGDSYFASHGRAFEPRFGAAPDPNLIAGRNPPFRKRDVSYLGPHEFVLEDRNSSRRLNQEELDSVAEAMALEEELQMLDQQMGELAYVDCVGDSCGTQVTRC